MISQTEALEALERRRAENKNRPRIDNSKLRAGDPMHFDCAGCEADIEVGENYTPPRPKFCVDCEPLAEQGLLPH